MTRRARNSWRRALHDYYRGYPSPLEVLLLGLLCLAPILAVALIR